MKIATKKTLPLAGLALLIALGAWVGYNEYSEQAFAARVKEEFKKEADAIQLANQLHRSEVLTDTCPKNYYGDGPYCANFISLYYGSSETADEALRKAAAGLKTAGWVVKDFESLATAEVSSDEVRRNPLKHLPAFALPMHKQSPHGVVAQGFLTAYHRATEFQQEEAGLRVDIRRLIQEHPEFEIIYEVGLTTDLLDQDALR